MKIKRIAAIHDMSGFGRCSLTVVIPVMSAAGIQVCPVPTAILSTHTGGFDNMVFEDMTDYINRSYAHYKSLGISFDAVYSGFLASSAQIDGCLRFFEGNPHALKVVDPVMGDNGTPYKTYTKELCARMSEIVRVADVITPNLTEAAILLNEPYTPTLNCDTAREWAERLCDMIGEGGAVVMTGVRISETGAVCNVGYSRELSALQFAPYELLPAHYPGTGDIFASVLTSALMHGRDLQSAIVQATAFAGEAVRVTYESGSEPREGVLFEGLLGRLPKIFSE
ncbi:MAG: pyridoxamine kinase [Oscillospiraceae bacterium]|nr:pyridoxamine kinase [Oscillospiraceae bacterium]